MEWRLLHRTLVLISVLLSNPEHAALSSSVWHEEVVPHLITVLSAIMAG